MYTVTPFTIEKFGLSLPAAVVEVEEVVSREDPNIFDQDDQNMPYKNATVRCKVFTDLDSYNGGRQPLDSFTKVILFEQADRDVIHGAALNVLFPPAIPE